MALVPLLEVRLQLAGPVAELTGFAVRPGAVGRGVDGLLLDAFETWAAQHGASRWKVTSGDHRNGANRFYERRGYVRSGRRFHKTAPGPV